LIPEISMREGGHMPRRKFLSVFSLIMILTLASSGLFAQGKAQVKPKAAPPLTVGDVLQGISYRSVGPTRQSGRFVDFAVPLQRPNTFYAATGSGGLWKTTNNGQTFEPIFDNEKVFSIGDVAVAPSDPDLLWVGSGEANNSRSTYWGDGLYKSTDAGKTWTNMGLKESHHIGRIVIHPTNRDIAYVAALGHLYSENPERGVFKTVDGGKTWVKSLAVVQEGRAVGCVDLVMDPGNPDVLYASAYDRIRRPWTYQVGGLGSGIYKTTDAGTTWSKLGGGLPGGILGRIGLAVCAKNPSVLYAMVENANKPGMSDADRWQEILDGKSSRGMIDGEIYRSEDAGATWQKVSPDKRSIGGNPGYYYGQIIVDPADDKTVFILSMGVLASRDGGKTWISPFSFGGDNHALWIDPKDSNHMLLGYDHGMGLTWDGGKSWYHPDFLPLAQFYAVDFDMSYPYRIAGGLQDNGSLMGPSTKRGTASGREYDFEGTTAGVRGGPPIRLEDWSTVGGGDGMYNVFDRKTNRYLYNEYQFGPLARIDLVTGETKSVGYQSQKPELRWNWCSPALVSAHNSDTIYHCGNIVVMSTNRGETWTEISPDLTTNDKTKMQAEGGKGGDQNIQYCTITTFDESPLVPGLLWVGTDDGNVWVTRDNGQNWTKLNDKITGNPGYWVSRVAASNFDPGTAYVTYTGFRNDDFRPFIYKTMDYGQTWTLLVGDLAAGPVNVVREDVKNSSLLFAGTDFGVYVSIDGGKHWTKMKNSMPTQPVHDLKIQPRENDLIVATHGRGAFIADISPLQDLSSEVLAKDAYLFPIKSKIRWVGLDRANSSSSNFAGQSEPMGIVVNYFLKTRPKDDVRVQVFMGNMLLSEIRGSANPGLNSAVWNMTGRRERTPEEKKALQDEMKRRQNRSFAGRGGADVNFASFEAREGEYRFVLVVDGKSYSRLASILTDYWYR
jgi:photosystem II stability/assembly factor-like uncharacterized protein